LIKQDIFDQLRHQIRYFPLFFPVHGNSRVAVGERLDPDQ
jgi:hypothetical protein